MRVSTYLIISPDKRRNNRYLKAGKVSGCRSRRPELAENEVAIKVNLELPDSIFDEFIPEATVTVPDTAVVRPEVEMMAEPRVR